MGQNIVLENMTSQAVLYFEVEGLQFTTKWAWWQPWCKHIWNMSDCPCKGFTIKYMSCKGELQDLSTMLLEMLH